MKDFIKKRLREQMIDGQNMSKSTENLCNKMTISSYQEAIYYVNKSLQQFNDSDKQQIMQKIKAPLENLKQEQNKIDSEIKNNHMSGDSMPDESDTYWAQIQSTICELGSDFK